MEDKLIKKYKTELEGWGFSFSSTKSPREFSPNIPTKKGVKEIPAFKGTVEALNALSLYDRTKVRL